MSGDRARLETEDGGRRVAPARWWTDRSVFLEQDPEQEDGLRVGEAVRLELDSGAVSATVALVCEAPRGVVVCFDRFDPTERWDDERETGRHDAQAALSALINGPPEGVGALFASEEPTNPSLRPAAAELASWLEPAKDKEPTDPGMTRLRATTQVNQLPDADPTEDA